MTTSDIFRSERLIYRGVDSPEDLPLFDGVTRDRVGFMNSNGANIELANKATSKQYMDYCTDKALLAAIICLPSADTTTAPPVPIGIIHLRAMPKGMGHHRGTEIGMNILPAFQAKGYGTEAIKWVLRYAFQNAGLHRVAISSYGFNVGALRLYERCGFVVESRRRDAVWHDGRFWDDVGLAMLEDEWREMVKKEESKESSG